MRTLAIALLALLCASCSATPPHADLTRDGVAQAAIYTTARVMGPDDPKINIDFPRSRDTEAEYQRHRLRESVKDLARCLEKMSGAKVEIITGTPAANDPRVPILIGELAEQKFGPPAKTKPFKQGFRVVVSSESPGVVGLIGESDLATSYAIYEVLDRLGCRWFIPSEMGECVPEMKTIRLEACDTSIAPGTIYRGIWMADEDYMRRNRLGGMLLVANQGLDGIIPKDELAKHPEWMAVIHGKTVPTMIKWSRPEVADAIAAALIDYIGKTGRTSVSLSPEDTYMFDESEDPKFDAGDMDPAFGAPSVSDRLILLCNRVATKVTAKYPDELFGVLAYVNYSRPPVREKVHPSIVPVLSPITYSRAHPVTDEGEPNNKALRHNIEGWGKASRMIGIYYFGWFLGEISAPYPMITKWSVDVPFALKNGCQFFQPETTSNFESSMYGLYLGNRLTFNPALDPHAIVDDINARFYGHAADAMGKYWAYVDQVWVGTPEYSGAAIGYSRRFPPAVMKHMRELLDAGVAAARTPMEKARIAMADESLKQFEAYMRMREDLAAGRFTNLGADAGKWVAREHALAEQYRPQFAFTCRLVGVKKWGSDNGVDYFESWYRGTYEDASRVAKDFQVLTPEPMRQWRYQQDAKREGEAQGFSKADLNDSAWKTTDVAIDSWSALGFHNYFGQMWYRATVKVPAPASGKRTYLWLAGTDGSARVFVNGKPCMSVNLKGEKAEQFVGFCKPASFEITDALSGKDAEQISVLCERKEFNEIGCGGLIGPAVVYREK